MQQLDSRNNLNDSGDTFMGDLKILGWSNPEKSAKHGGHRFSNLSDEPKGYFRNDHIDFYLASEPSIFALPTQN